MSLPCAVLGESVWPQKGILAAGRDFYHLQPYELRGKREDDVEMEL